MEVIMDESFIKLRSTLPLVRFNLERIVVRFVQLNGPLGLMYFVS